MNIGVAGDLLRRLGGEVGLPLVIDRHRIAALIDQVDLGAGHLRHAGDDLAHPLLDQLAHLRGEGTDGTSQLGGLRDDVAGIAGVELAHRNHRGVQRIDGARHDRLQGLDQLRPDQDGIDAFVRTRRVAAQPLDPDIDGVRRRHDRTGPDRERADRNSGAVVHAIDLVAGETVHQPVLDHRGGSRAALFRRLEDDDRIAGEIPGLGEIARRAQQHRGVPVMATGVHLARRLRRVRQIGRLLDRQRIHVGAQPDHLCFAVAGGLAALDDADDAGTAEPGGDLVAAEFPQPVRDECCSAMHVIQQFGMLMDIAAPGLDIGLQIGDAVDDGHGRSRLRVGMI